MIFFTDNYQDRSTSDGYQFEFFCRRCGNGYSSSFQHSVTGFGGRLLRLGGDLVGGAVGEKAQQLGWDAEWMRDGARGSTRDKALTHAVEEMKPFFHQCHRCGQWVCEQVCCEAEVEVRDGMLVLAPRGEGVMAIPFGRIMSVTEPEPFTVRLTLAGGDVIELGRLGVMRTQLLAELHDGRADAAAAAVAAVGEGEAFGAFVAGGAGEVRVYDDAL
ncbi:MAG TPA: hypothetical protein VGU21_05460, partial [Streptosporangiaceae bacterium]|nr:hypothetical protein [Streptosporangiaceae bacterium]